MRTSLLSAATIAALSASALGASTQPLINSSFETPKVTGAFLQTSSIPGWTGSAGIEIQTNGSLGAGQGTPFGNQYVELNVNAPSTLSQTVTTVAGESYTLSYYLSARPGTGTNTISVGFTGAPTKTVSVPDTGSVNFTNFTETFVATGPKSTLSFTPIGPFKDPGQGDLLDNVSLSGAGATAGGGGSAVPLPPAAWSGLSGLAALGLIRASKKLRWR